MDPVTYEPIGVIRSPHVATAGMPIQPSGAADVRGRIELRPELVEGLRDLDGFSHLVLIYHFHQAGAPKLVVTPFLDDAPHGVFATRAPRRPNPIGLSVVRLISLRENVLEIEGVDVLDGTPLLDLKPYVPEFDAPQDVRTGWVEKARGASKTRRSDHRFEDA